MFEFVHGGDIYSNNQQDCIDFSANINPLGLPTEVRKAIVDNIDSYVNYPDPLCRELKAALCEYYFKEKQIALKESNIVCGNGAADLIFRLVLFLRPKKAMVLSPTFAEYETALDLVGCEVMRHKLTEENGFYLNEIIINQISGIDMLLICNPNNPTGIAVDADMIIKIADRCRDIGATLVVDECFCEFLENESVVSIINKIQEYPNIIVLKAFTKLYAMAGIRLGYILCSDNIVNEGVQKTLQPWSVSTVAIKCGVSALKESEYVKLTKQLITQNRGILMGELQKLGFKVFDSKANYVFFKSNDTELSEKLKRERILIRSCKNYVGLDGRYYRVAVKSLEQNQALINCLKNLKQRN